MSQKKRFTEIDALRGLAAIAVILFHYTTYYDDRFGHLKEGYIDFFWFGEYGVQLFFIISGFVIYMSIMKATVPPSRFCHQAVHPPVSGVYVRRRPVIRGRLGFRDG